MNKLHYIYPFIICCAFFILSINKGLSQEGQAPGRLIVLAKPADSTTIKLRWAPRDRTTYNKGHQAGYTISRYTIATADSTLSLNAQGQSYVVLDSTIHVLDSVGWLSKMDTLNPDPYIELGYGVLFDDSLNVQISNPDSIAEIVDYDNKEESRYQLGMLASELSFDAAVYNGLGFVDSTVISGWTYLYYIRMNTPEECMGWSEILVDQSLYILPSPIIMKGMVQGGIVGMNFKGDAKAFITYDVERSEDHENFVQLNEEPILPSPMNEDYPDIFSYADSVTVVMGLYIYRIRGRDVFGNTSDWSDTIHIYNLPAPIGVAAQFDSVVIHQELYTKLYWSFPDEVEQDILGFKVYRSHSRFEPKILVSGNDLLPVTTREFVDTNPLQGNYYFVQVRDIHGYDIDSWPGFVQFSDTIPPVKPGLPTGLANKKGRVRVHWPANPDSDVAGYRVYFCNREEGEYTQLTLTVNPDTVFRYDMDIMILESKTYVKIRAVDGRGNLSELSDPCEILLPDIVPPTAAVIIKAVSTDSINRITFIPSQSDDVQKYEIRRKEKDTPHPFQTIGERAQSAQKIHFNDTTANSNIAYQYSVYTIDYSGNTSPSNVATIIGPLPQRPPVIVKDIMVVYKTNITGDKVGLVISWDYALYKDLVGFKIYRSMDAEPFVQYAVYNINEAKGLYDSVTEIINVQGEYRYIDRHVFPTRRYRYQVVAMFSDGTFSPASNNLTKVYN